MAFTLRTADCQITGSPVYNLSYDIMMRLVIAVLQQVLPFRFVISLNPVSPVYRIAYVCFVSMFPYLALFLARLALY